MRSDEENTCLGALGGTWRGGAGVADDAVPPIGVMAVLPLVAEAAAVASGLVDGQVYTWLPAVWRHDGHWYKMTAKPGTYNDNDPIGVPDVTILSNLVLDKVFGIKDLRTDKRIDLVGGIRGLGELKRRVDNGDNSANGLYIHFIYTPQSPSATLLNTPCTFGLTT